MKTIIKIIVGLLMSVSFFSAMAERGVAVDSVKVSFDGDDLRVNARLLLDSLQLSPKGTIFITPVLKIESKISDDNISGSSDSNEKELYFPSVLISGGNKSILDKMGKPKKCPEFKNHNVLEEIHRVNGSEQNVNYIGTIPVDYGMLSHKTRLVFVLDSCGCGGKSGHPISDEIKIFSDPVSYQIAPMPVADITYCIVSIPLITGNMQFHIDGSVTNMESFIDENVDFKEKEGNRKLTEDELLEILSNPDMEISYIYIRGVCSPDSPYSLNEGRAKRECEAVVDFFVTHLGLPKDAFLYDTSPEDWYGFRHIVELSDDISEEQRALLLDLIDSPVSSPEDYDNKEEFLKTDPKIRNLYFSKILPEWFPRLRVATFEIYGGPRMLTDEELMKRLETQPEKLSLNDMFRLARLFREGSEEYNRIMEIALRYYPKDSDVVFNVASAKVNKGDYVEAKKLISSAYMDPALYNLLGIISCAEESYDEAIQYFYKAYELPEAEENLKLLKLAVDGE